MKTDKKGKTETRLYIEIAKIAVNIFEILSKIFS